jgi:hypothetical protein
MKPFFSSLFELLTTFLIHYDDKSIIEHCLIVMSKCWLTISRFILNELLIDKCEQAIRCDAASLSHNQLFENALQFYSIYLSCLTQLSGESERIQTLCEKMSCLFDYEYEKTSEHANESSSKTLGTQLCSNLIRQFDKYFIVDTNQTLKQIVANMMKSLLSLSESAKRVALDCKL